MNDNNIKIRKEKPDDYHKVEEVTREAFWNLYMPGCNEFLLAHKLRTHKDYIPELTFVIEMDGEIVGSIFYSKSKVIIGKGKDGTTEIPTISFGPVSIHPAYHRKGLGRKLIAHSIEEAKKLGYKAILIQGYPHHYTTYGFVSAKKFGVSAGDGKFYRGTMALPLQEGALSDAKGIVQFSGVFEQVSDEKEIEAYDKNFPPKEKGFQHSQKDFEAACQLLDDE